MMLPFTGFINTTNNFDFELHSSKPKFIAKRGGRQSKQLSFQFLLKSHAMILISKKMLQSQLFA
jgi:hypothetical protein